MKNTYLNKKACIILLFVMTSTCLFSQKGTITGKVTDKELNEILPGALVQATRDTIKVAAICGIDGTYSLPLDTGTYDVATSFIGYNSVVIQKVKVGDSTIYLNFEMEESAQLLSYIEVKDYKVPLIQKDVVYCSSTVMGCISSSSKSLNMVSRKSKKNKITSSQNYLSDESDLTVNDNQYTGLTAGQTNDFGKWELWKDIAKSDLKNYQNIWKLYPLNRYPVQVVSAGNKPIVDAVVYLKDNDGSIIWTTRTDNTGKAELWDEMYDKKSSKEKTIIVNYKGNEYTSSAPVKFPEGTNMFVVPAECEIPDMVDIAVVVDATGSMDDEISYLKNELVDILDKTESNYPDLTINLGSVFYRCPANSYVTKKSDFSTNLKKTLSFINEQYSGEGGDEAVEQALDVAVNQLQWSTDARSRIMVLVLDEPPAMDDSIITKIQKVLPEAASKGIRIIPVVCSGEGYEKDRNLEYLMRSIALGTNGTYVFLTDHSQIGNSHSVPVTDEYDVELLNDMLIRLIYEYTFVPDCNKPIDAKDIMDTMFVFNPKVIAHEVADSTLLGKYDNNVKVSDTMLVIFNVTDSVSYNAKQDSIETAVVLVTDSSDTEIKNEKFRNFKYYPNPTSDLLYIEFDGEVNEIYLADVSGKLLEKYKPDNERLQIDLSKYPTGIYFVQCFYNDKWLTGKMIKS